MTVVMGQYQPGRRMGAPPARSRLSWMACESAAWLGILLAALAVAGLATVALAPRLVHWQFVVVAGGSMEPTIPFGSLAVMEPLGSRPPAAGDIVMYRDPSRGGAVVTHRVESVASDGLTLTTRGDANPSADLEPIPIAAVDARYRFAIPWAGRLVYLTHTRTGYAAMVLAPGLVIIAWELASVARAIGEGRRLARGAVPAIATAPTALPLALLLARSSPQHSASAARVGSAGGRAREW